MAEATSDDILDAAKKLFEQQGYTATSMRQIAEAAEVAKATIYHHFPDKTALFRAALNRTLESQRPDPAALAAEPDPRQRLRAATLACLRLLASGMDLIHIARREVPAARASLQAENATAFGMLARLFAETIEEGGRTGTFRKVDSKRAAQTLLALIQGTYASAALSGSRIPDPEPTAEQFLDIFFRGIDAR